MNAIIGFVARSIEEEPEMMVGPDTADKNRRAESGENPGNRRIGLEAG